MSFIASQPGGGNGARLNLDRLREARQRLHQQQTPATTNETGATTTTTTHSVGVGRRPATIPVAKEANTIISAHDTGLGMEAPAPPAQRPALTPEFLQHEAHQALQANAPTAQQAMLPKEAPLPLEGKYGLPLQDIQHIAQESGFIGISQENIERAYLKRQSLLVDYRI